MRVQQGQWSRRSFLKTTAAGVAAAGVAGSFARIADAADGLRSIGLGVSEINEIQDKATKDLGFPVRRLSTDTENIFAFYVGASRIEDFEQLIEQVKASAAGRSSD